MGEQRQWLLTEIRLSKNLETISITLSSENEDNAETLVYNVKEIKRRLQLEVNLSLKV